MKAEQTKKHTGSYDYRISKDNIYHPFCYGKHLLYQIGRMHCNMYTSIPVHTHLNYIEFTVATDGRATVITNGRSVNIQTGDIYVSFAGDFHEIIVDPANPLKYDFITVQTTEPLICEELEKIVADRYAAEDRIIRDDYLRQLVARAINEINNDDGFTDTVMEAIIGQILITMIRDFERSNSNLRDTAANEAQLICLRLMNYIDNHIYTIKNLREMTEITNYSYNYMSNLFKKVTSDTLMNYYKNRRLQTARLLLQSGQFSVTDISSMLNYSSVYSFSLAFKKKYGYPPSEEKED